MRENLHFIQMKITKHSYIEFFFFGGGTFSLNGWQLILYCCCQNEQFPKKFKPGGGGCLPAIPVFNNQQILGSEWQHTELQIRRYETKIIIKVLFLPF
jgi:hypothetical protein